MSHVVRTAAPSPPSSDEPGAHAPARYFAGDVIGEKYKLVSLLGEGGMGSVWVATNVPLDTLVALKLVRNETPSQALEDRFLTEARAAARLKHPAICRVFDFGRTRLNEPFMVMELLQGESLGELLDREWRMPAVEAVRILLPIADALAAAHAKGVVHRDLKPDNVFLSDRDGRLEPKILDFGIAKLARGPAGDHKITQAGTVVGSPDYLSPEQARGLEDIDHRADVWQFCVLLYECVTGRVPFEDANYNALLRHIIEDRIVPITDLDAGDPELWQILDQGFAKDRELRYQNMRELGSALASWLLARGVSEDVTGHSLRAAWLEPPQRLSLAPSGEYKTAAPVPVSERPVTPVRATPEAPSAEPAATETRRPSWAIIVAGVSFVAAGFVSVGLWLRRDASDETERRAASGTATAAVAVAAPGTTVAPVASGAPSVSSTSTSTPTREKKAEGSAPAGGGKAKASPKSTPSAPTPAKPKGAYAEDLGF